jgi:hypothetical protein
MRRVLLLAALACAAPTAPPTVVVTNVEVVRAFAVDSVSLLIDGIGFHPTSNEVRAGPVRMTLPSDLGGRVILTPYLALRPGVYGVTVGRSNITMIEIKD